MTFERLVYFSKSSIDDSSQHGLDSCDSWTCNSDSTFTIVLIMNLGKYYILNSLQGHLIIYNNKVILVIPPLSLQGHLIPYNRNHLLGINFHAMVYTRKLNS